MKPLHRVSFHSLRGNKEEEGKAIHPPLSSANTCAMSRVRTKSRDELEAHFKSFVELHDSPSRKKFALEFSASVLPPEGAVAAESPGQPTSFASRMGKGPLIQLSGPRRETTNQLAFPGHNIIPSFAPETKHRYLKAADHEYTEQMFTLWNIHGKKGSGLL